MLEIRNLVCGYGKVMAVKGVSLTVERGQLVALIGANGAGKTTLLRAISGLLPVASGAIRFERTDITRAPARSILSLGLAHCPEGRRVFSHLTVAENLAMGGYLRSDRAALAQDLRRIYDQFPRLGERRRQMAGTLSGGEQQMLALGRALMSRPKLIMFDEPSLGLAPTVVERTFEIIRDIRASGITILMIEHVMQAVMTLCEHIYVLAEGRIIAQGPPETVARDERVIEAYLGQKAKHA